MKKLSLSVLVLSFISLSALAQSSVQKSLPGNMPNRLSMNVTVPKQTAKSIATNPDTAKRQTPNTSFGAKVNAAKPTASQATGDTRTYTSGRRTEAIIAPTAADAGKSISEKGVKRN